MGPTANAQWIHDSPVHSEVEEKLRHFLVELGKENKILGMQVIALFFFFESAIVFIVSNYLILEA